MTDVLADLLGRPIVFVRNDEPDLLKPLKKEAGGLALVRQQLRAMNKRTGLITIRTSDGTIYSVSRYALERWLKKNGA